MTNDEKNLAKEIIDRASTLIQAGGWVQKGWAKRDDRGISLRDAGPGDAFCTWGACLKAMEEHGFGVTNVTRVGNYVGETIERSIREEDLDKDNRNPLHVTSWNDNHCKMKEDVLIVLHRAKRMIDDS